MHKKILITGFDPFDQAQRNPSADWISWMNARPAPAGKVIKGRILPGEFLTAFNEFKSTYDEFLPDLVILTGLASNRSELSVERIGVNWQDARIPDNAGVMSRMAKIIEEGPDGIFTTLSLENVQNILNKIPMKIKISTSAGEYVCNELLYRVLHYVKDTAQVTFIHLPGVESYDGIYLALEQLVHEL